MKTKHPPHRTAHQEAAKTLLDTCLERYRNAVRDRRAIHTIEWNGNKDDFSVLGEVDVRDVELAGIATTFIDSSTPHRLPDAHLALLHANGVLSDPEIQAWAREHSRSFPDFADYLASLESLRLFLLEQAGQRTPGHKDDSSRGDSDAHG